MYEATIRIPTDPYAYFEVKVSGEPEEIIATYREFKKLYEGGVGLDDKTWRLVLDNYLWGDETMATEEYVSMSRDQQDIIQEIKRSKKRAQRKGILTD